MKKRYIIVPALLVAFVIGAFILSAATKTSTFYLEDSYYNSNETQEIELDELNRLIDTQETFGVFVYQPLCVTSSDFEEVLNTFQEQYQIGFKKIAFSKVKNSQAAEFLQYYPSFIIYKDGKMVDFLEANKDEDLQYYQSVEGFKDWLANYVKLEPKSASIQAPSNTSSSENQNSQEQDLTKIEVGLENITKEDGKVNIYFFWGNGCSHCKREFKFLERLQKEYGDKYNLYTFEVWYNDENAKILDVFTAAMKEDVKGVPYTIIGSKSFYGFGNGSEQQFKAAIKNQYQGNNDIYFDKIKK